MHLLIAPKLSVDRDRNFVIFDLSRIKKSVEKNALLGDARGEFGAHVGAAAVQGEQANEGGEALRAQMSNRRIGVARTS